jgi:hypothetical protein
VRRSRSHVAQNGCVTVATTPISPTLSRNLNRSAGEGSPAVEALSRDQTSQIFATISAEGTTRSFVHESAASSGMKSMKRTGRPRECRELEDLVVTDAGPQDDFDFHRLESGCLSNVHRREHRWQIATTADFGEPLGAQRIATDVDPPQSRARERHGDSCQLHRVRGERDVLDTQLGEIANELNAAAAE